MWKWFCSLVVLFVVTQTLADEPRWISWPAVRQVESKYGNVLGDIKSHVQSFQWYDGGKWETTAHENSHECNADVRRKYGNNGTYAGLYCLQDRALAFPNPKISAQTALKNVPRGGVLMWSVLAEWDNDHQPLYVFDELTAYTNGLQCALENNLEPAQQKHDFVAIAEFQRYCYAIVKEIELKQPDYAYLQLMKDYLAWNEALVNTLKGSPIEPVGPTPDYHMGMRR